MFDNIANLFKSNSSSSTNFGLATPLQTMGNVNGTGNALIYFIMRNYYFLLLILFTCQACQSNRKIISIKGKQVFQIPLKFKEVSEKEAISLLKNFSNIPFIQNVNDTYNSNGLLIGLRYNPENTMNGKNEQEMKKLISTMSQLFKTGNNNLVDISVQNFNGIDFVVANISNKDSFFLFNSNTNGGGYNLYGGFIRYDPVTQEKQAKVLLKHVLENIKSNSQSAIIR